ncbi:MAG TPA: IMP dehydrogenase [Candidatus Acidoferrales bacterium]|jgi:IMP dehydrogenase|nr:IMP dehydrogenase [Candidatus Acidoferrales bacterium]
MIDGPIPEGLTFDDVLLLPGKSSVLPAQADTRTCLSRKIALNIPIVAAAMDTVTDARLAIAISRQGGIGFVHRNMTIDRQAEEVDRVKRSESGMIVDPVTIAPEMTVRQALEMMNKYKVSGVPVTRGPRLVGILTNRDLRFERNLDQPVANVMTKDNLITVPVGTTLEEAEHMLQRHRIEKLLVVDKDFNLKGLITVKDIQKKIEFPNATKDPQGRLRVGAAIGATGDYLERAEEMAKANVDAIAIDTAHGHTSRVMDAIRNVKRKFPDLQLLAGNVATAEGARDLIALGIDGLKVGIGPGSICTTRVVTGAGVPQITAILEATRAAEGTGVPVIADGGIKFSGDITKAIAAGASAVMIGGLFAGTEESPGETILYQGRTFKSYRGMGSLGAMEAGSADRYAQEGVERGKSVPEGIEGQVPYKGPLSGLMEQLVGGLRSGMGYCGAANLKELQERSKFIRISSAGLRESHVHDVIITREAPNYRLE